MRKKKSMTDTTSIETKTEILSDLYLEFKGDEKFSDFFAYNDLGLPLAYAISSEIVQRTNRSDLFIEETFELLLEVLGVGEDTGFDTLDDILPTPQ